MIWPAILSCFQSQQELVLIKFSIQVLPKQVISGTAKEKSQPVIRVLCKYANIPYTDDNNITKTMCSYSNLHLNATGSTTFVCNICKALCDSRGYVCKGLRTVMQVTHLK